MNFFFVAVIVNLVLRKKKRRVTNGFQVTRAPAFLHKTLSTLKLTLGITTANFVSNQLQIWKGMRKIPLILGESATAAAPWCHPGNGESLQPAWLRLAHGHCSVWPLLKCINSVLFEKITDSYCSMAKPSLKQIYIHQKSNHFLSSYRFISQHIYHVISIAEDTSA